MDVTIREAGTDDVPSLDILRRQAVEDAFGGVYDRSTVADLVATDTEDLRSWIADDRYDVRLAETEVTAVCYGVLDREACRIEALWTSPDYQREGFASLLLDRIEQDADCDRLAVVAPEPAVPFFQAVGFAATAEATWHGLPAEQLETDR